MDDRYYPWKRDSRQIRWVASRRVGRGAVTSAEKCSEIVKDRFEPRPLGRLRQLLSTMQFPVRFPYANPTVID